MGLHPKAITAVMLLVLDLLWRGYRIVLSTHSPHVATVLWMMRRLQAENARWQLVCEAFNVRATQPMQKLVESVLAKDYRTYLFDFASDQQVSSTQISGLDPTAADEREAGWGGLTEYSSRLGQAVREAVNEAAP